MCVNTYRFEGNREKWMEITGPVLMYVVRCVAEVCFGLPSFRLVSLLVKRKRANVQVRASAREQAARQQPLPSDRRQKDAGRHFR